MILLVLGERLVQGRPPHVHHNRFQTRRENGDTTSLENPVPRAIADVGEAWPSRSGRVRCYSCHGMIVIPSAGKEYRRRERAPP